MAAGWHVYRPAAWSPDGQWIVLHVGHYEGWSAVLLNVESGGLVPVPSSSSYSEAGVSLAFSADSRFVIVARWGQRPLLSVLDLATAVDRAATSADLSQLDIDPWAFNPIVSESGIIRFGLATSDRAYPGTGLFELGEGGALRRLAPGPFQRAWSDYVIWSGPGSAVMVAHDDQEWIETGMLWSEALPEILDISEVLRGTRWPQWGAGRR